MCRVSYSRSCGDLSLASTVALCSHVEEANISQCSRVLPECSSAPPFSTGMSHPRPATSGQARRARFLVFSGFYRAAWKSLQGVFNLHVGAIASSIGYNVTGVDSAKYVVCQFSFQERHLNRPKSESSLERNIQRTVEEICKMRRSWWHAAK